MTRQPLLAVYVFALVQGRAGDDHVAALLADVARTWGEAARSDGFVARIAPGAPMVPVPRVFDPARDSVSLQVLSCWASLEAAHAFVHGTAHAAVSQRYAPYVARLRWPMHAAWWTRALPTYGQAAKRLEHLHASGVSAAVFQVCPGAACSMKRVRDVKARPEVE